MMLRLKSILCCLMLLSLALPLGNAWAKQPSLNKDSVSAITLDVLRVEACAKRKGCVVAGGPMQVNLLDMAEDNINYGKQVLLPERTMSLRLILGDNSTITVDGESFPLTVFGGKRLKLEGWKKAFPREGGFLSNLELKLNLKKQLVVQRKKVWEGWKNWHGKKKVSYVYSYHLKPFILVRSAAVEQLPENMAAAVVAMPGEESEIKIGENFSLVIPAGAVAAPMVISVKETKYTVEVMNEETGEVVEKPALSSNYELSPDGAKFNEPLVITIPYHPETLPSEVSEYDLAVYLDGEKLPTDINIMPKTATAEVWHFTSATVSYPASNFVFPVNGLPRDTACPSDTENPYEVPRQPGIDRTWYSVVWGGIEFNGKWDTRCKGTGGHPGVDIRVPSDTPVKAIASGIVYKSYDSSTWGGLVVIKHEVKGISEPVWSVYAHLKKRNVQERDPISVAGQKIGWSGGASTDPNHGNSTGSHLHFQIDKGSVFLYPYFPSTGTEKFDASLSTNTYDPLKFIEEHTSNGSQPPASCPNGNGLYCGDSGLGQNVNTLYSCQNGSYSVQEQCANGCQTMPSGTNDQCKEAPASCPNGNGLYCGKSSLGQNTNYLYSCQNGSYSLQEQCANGCQTMPSGTNDQCKEAPASCPNGNGLYCGDSGLGQNVNTLYSCQNGSYSVQEQCANGCEVMSSGVDDQCKGSGSTSGESFTCTSGSQVQRWGNRDWQRCDDGNTYLWQEAKDYCDNLVLGGYSDWRLPTKDELKSLVVCTNGTPTPLADYPEEPYGCGSNNGGKYDTPTIDSSFECHPELYWSSTPKEVTNTSPLASKELAWDVDFYYGNATWSNPNTVHSYVRCVR